MSARCRHRRRGQSRRSCTDHRDSAHEWGTRKRSIHQLGFAPRPRIDEAARALIPERLIETGLIARDTGVDFVRASFGGFQHEV
jgi:hypothetical protein